MNKEYIKISIDEIIPYDNNPRINDQAVPAVAESIKQVGCAGIQDIQAQRGDGK